MTEDKTFRIRNGIPMIYVIKAAISNRKAKSFKLIAQKTMYGGKKIAPGDTVFLFASENEGGAGLIARGIVISSRGLVKKRGLIRQTPRVSVHIRRTALAARPLGRAVLKPFNDWQDGQPQTELNFKLYRQATNKIVSISEGTSNYLKKFFV